MTSYLEQVLASQDLRFQAALAKAGALYHAGTRGAQFEEQVLAIIRDFLPGTYRARDALLAPGGEIEKQLDLVVHPWSIPPLFEQLLPIELITVAGEIKTNLKDKNDIRSTARKLADAAVASRRQKPVPFFVLAGSLDCKDHAKWLADLISFVSYSSLSWPLWLAVFSFDKNQPMSALRVNESSPIRAVTTDDEVLDGVVTISGQQLSPSAVCYLWIWAAIYASDAAHGMDFRYMRDEVERLCAKEGGVEVQFQPSHDTGKMTARHVSFLLPEDQAIATVHVPVHELAPPADETPAVGKAERADPSRGRRKVMLITLGPWVDEPDSWDESAWGGSPTATRRGYGYYSGMANDDLLDSCRLFWRFNPESVTWRGIEYAVVAHDGRTRAVVQISRYIGPFWGRHGFHGHVVTDAALVEDLVGREVPRRQNPITTIEL